MPVAVRAVTRSPGAWRVGVPAIGLVVAVLVGWRLSPEDTVLVLFCAWLPLVLWCAFVPRVRVAAPIAPEPRSDPRQDDPGRRRKTVH
jgi:hypothetical protein